MNVHVEVAWRCAIVPEAPVVVTLPLTDPSSLMVKVPLPESGTQTGGSSSAPLEATPDEPEIAWNRSLE
jgi:hypothetical protein